MTQEIVSYVVAFLTKGAHTFEVLHRGHPSTLIMMHTSHKLWGVSRKKKSITGTGMLPLPVILSFLLDTPDNIWQVCITLSRGQGPPL